MFYRPRRQPESLLVILHCALNTYHRPSHFQPADTHATLYVSGKHLILKSCYGLLEHLALMLQSAIAVDLGYERPITDLTKHFIHAVMPHVVSL
jgi:hypothetical protein